MKYPRLLQLAFCAVAVVGCTGFEEMTDPNEYAVNSISMQEVAVRSSTLDIPFSARLDIGPSAKGKAGFVYSKDSRMSSPTELKVERSGNTMTASLHLKDYGETFYIKAYFKSDRSRLESDVCSFSLLPFTEYVSVGKPSLSSISSATAAVSSSFVAATGVELDSYRLEISKTDNPFTALTSTEAKVTNNLISATFKDLDPGKAYYIRARVSETSNSSYSEILEITTSTSLALWGTPTVSNITSSSAKVSCRLASDGGLSISQVGIVYSTAKSPTTNSSKIIAEKTEVGDYSFDLSSLDPGKTYYVRCYAINEKGTAYSSEVSFNSAIRLATVTTSAITSVSAYSATAGGEVTDDGGSAVTERGIVWSEYSNPTISTASKKTSGTGTGKFECQITSLAAGKTYYVRAYATNAKGTAYGEEKSFSTSTVAPTVITSTVIRITSDSAECGGEVMSDGGTSVTARGVVWSTKSNPTVDLHTKTVNGSGTGSFTSSITGLEPGTKYYVRAYATNAEGTSYGEETTFTTSAVAPTVTTSSVSQITGDSAVCGGNVTADGGASVTVRGVVWSTKSTPTVGQQTKTADGTGTGSFTSSITGLEPGTKYYVRAYATNAKGTSYGEETTFTTSAVAPTVTTSSVTSITSDSAVCGGNVTADGGATVTSCGVVWSTKSNPTVDLETKTADGTGTGSFTSSITGLEPGTTYYVRAYATNAKGTSYGKETAFKTSIVLPTVSTSSTSDITSDSAVCGGNVTADGGASVTARGVVWNTKSNPTVDLETKTADGTGTGSFTSSITGLEPGTKYYVRAYATNSKGTSYGEETTFTTLTVAPTVVTSSVTSITSDSAVCGGEVTDSGGLPVTARGVQLRTPGSVTTYSCGTGTGSFSSSITGLEQGTTYYVRAYATNANGTSYGEETAFTTTTVVPTVTTASVTNNTGYSAECGGNVTADGGTSVTARGVVWSNGGTPTVDLETKTVDGSGTGSFTSSITGLQPGLVYFVRAYATNDNGTSYGESIRFMASGVVPSVTTSDIANITSYSAVCGGTAYPITGSINSCGVVWSTNPNPTVDLETKTVDTWNKGSFTSRITGLVPGTTYYVRAYATNWVGTGYGEEITFTTTGLGPTVTTSSVTNKTYYSAVCGGNVTDEGTEPVTARGVVWSTTPDPTVDLETKTVDGSGTGSFTSSLTGLYLGTLYYVRAYATNAVCTSYGPIISFYTLKLGEYPE